MVDTQDSAVDRQPIERPCRACGKRPYEKEYVCAPCRLRLPFRLRDLEDLYVELTTEAETDLDDRDRTEYLGRPSDVSQRIVWSDGAWREGPSTLGRRRDPVAAELPVPPMRSRSKAPSVSGTREASTPLDLARADLLAPAIRVGGRPVASTPEFDFETRRRLARRDLYERSHLVPKVITTFADHPVYAWDYPPARAVDDGETLPAPAPQWRMVYRRMPTRTVVRDEHGKVVLVPTGDQVGHPSIAQVLDQWARDIHSVRVHRYGERRPVPAVPAMIRWLTDRVDWICDEYDGVGDLLWSITSLVGVARSVLGLTDPLPQVMLGVYCRRCDNVSCIQHQAGDKYLECTVDGCGELYSREEWTEWTRLLAAAEKARRPAAEIRLLQCGRCPGCRHYLHPVPSEAWDERGCRDPGCHCGWTGYADPIEGAKAIGPAPPPVAPKQPTTGSSGSGPCSCACHIGGAFRPACTVAGGCGSIGCDGYGRINGKGSAA